MVLEGCQQGGDLGELCSLPPMVAGGPLERGRPAIPPPPGHTAIPGHRGARGPTLLGPR